VLQSNGYVVTEKRLALDSGQWDTLMPVAEVSQACYKDVTRVLQSNVYGVKE
jgi:hypothetical protein